MWEWMRRAHQSQTDYIFDHPGLVVLWIIVILLFAWIAWKRGW